ncbi:hypothetical protein [Hymenobacter cheonanensis]|uniref:hypothetical protein n=1 Tax=Hymenobacter sp. CA2-7 TaxID=3063993 RepID=UPI00271370FD|nr:hypothetical protein [Hymenobacter sp. CA2-7]MDO7884343.1 hypothetical protein [Hymenobacter sp. CA2-7]
MAAASTDGEKAYTVLTRVLAANLALAQKLAEVGQRQRELQVRFDLRATQTGIDEYKQAQHKAASQSKR